MKRRTPILLILLVLITISCAETDVHMNPPGGNNSSSDLDSDGDAVTDSDTDIDTSLDTDIDKDFEECVEVYEEADSEIAPVDIIFAVDNSPSMVLETGFVKKNLNKLNRLNLNQNNFRIFLKQIRSHQKRKFLLELLKMQLLI